MRFYPESANSLKRLVGAWRFELQTSCAQGLTARRINELALVCGK